LLHSSGAVSAEQAGNKALEEYGKFKKIQDKKYISDFDKEIKKLKKIIK